MSDPVGGRGAEIEAVWLCPVHADEFWVPHGGRCPAPGCDKDLVKYVRSSGSAAQNHEEPTIEDFSAAPPGWPGSAAQNQEDGVRRYQATKDALAARSPQDEDHEEGT